MLDGSVALAKSAAQQTAETGYVLKGHGFSRAIKVIE
jgi:hypothetical protein